MNKIIYLIVALFTFTIIACEVEQTEVMIEGIVFERIASDCNTNNEEAEQDIMLRTYKSEYEYLLVGEQLENQLVGIPLGKSVVVEGLLLRGEIEVISITKPVSFLDASTATELTIE